MMEKLDNQSLGSHISTYKLLKIGLIANAFEWYEFSVFGFLAGIMGTLFFESDLYIIQVFRAFTLFAVTYLMRPLGSIFFGVMGDRKGRRFSLRLSLILITIPTVLIGFLPTYAQWGTTATIALFGLRLIQGFAMGGELPATAYYVFEAANPKYRSLLCSAVGAAPKIGLLLGSLVVYLITQGFDQDALLTWAWRIPFWLGIPLTLFIVHIRQKIQETPDFSRVKQHHSNAGILTHLHSMMAPLIQATCLCVFLNVGYPILTIWMPFYLNHFLNIPTTQANLVNTLTLCAMIPFCLGTGFFSKRIGYQKLFTGSIIATLILIIPLFKGLQNFGNSSIGILLSLHFIFAFLMSIGQGVFFELVNDLFKPANRSLGVSLTTILPAALIAGTIPLVCSYVVHKTGWLSFPAVYIIISGLIALPASLKLKSQP